MRAKLSNGTTTYIFTIFQEVLKYIIAIELRS